MIFAIILNEYFYIDFFILVPILGTPGTSGYVKFLLALLRNM